MNAKRKGMTPEPIEPAPANLTPIAAELWKGCIWECREPGRRELLHQALLALDRANQARELVAADLTTTTEGARILHLNPLVRVEQESRKQFLQIMRALGLAARETKWH
jgi:hypothetical protein